MEGLQMSDKEMAKLFSVKGFQYPHPGFSVAETMRFFPTLEFNGITGGYCGEGIKTIIPCSASVKITCRLVCDQKAATVRRLLADALEKLRPNSLSMEVRFQQEVNPYFLDVENCQNGALLRGIQLAKSGIGGAFGHEPLFLRDGGSIGFVTMLKEILAMDSLLIGLSSPEDSIHAPNESIAIPVLESGREFFRNFFLNF
jgi:acetylornithine deacetylase/succinyl-diaminopimelate desuccinylase-like protein